MQTERACPGSSMAEPAAAVWHDAGSSPLCSQFFFPPNFHDANIFL